MTSMSAQASPATHPTATKGRRTANRILDAAEALFAQNGYGATSLRDIAALAGLQQPGLYKHFVGKEDLYRQVYERALKPMTDLMDEVLASPEGGFGALTDRITDLLRAHPNIARLLIRAISSDAEPDPVAIDWLTRLVDYGRKLTDSFGVPSSDRLAAVQIVSVFNVMFGYFWASPLIERLSGHPASDPRTIESQKSLLNALVGAMAQAGAGTAA